VSTCRPASWKACGNRGPFLEFSTLQPEPGFQFEGIAEKLIRKFEAEGYDISTRVRGGINASCLLRFPALLHHDQASLLAGT